MQVNPNFYLFLDDERWPQHVTWVKIPQNVEWTIVRNYKDFVEAIAKNGIPAFVSFDHDLGLEHYKAHNLAPDGATYEDVYGKATEKTGMDCLKWLVEQVLQPNSLPMPPHALHTYSLVGERNMRAYINSYNKSVLKEQT